MFRTLGLRKRSDEAGDSRSSEVAENGAGYHGRGDLTIGVSFKAVAQENWTIHAKKAGDDASKPWKSRFLMVFRDLDRCELRFAA